MKMQKSLSFMQKHLPLGLKALCKEPPTKMLRRLRYSFSHSLKIHLVVRTKLMKKVLEAHVRHLMQIKTLIRLSIQTFNKVLSMSQVPSIIII